MANHKELADALLRKRSKLQIIYKTMLREDLTNSAAAMLQANPDTLAGITYESAMKELANARSAKVGELNAKSRLVGEVIQAREWKELTRKWNELRSILK